MGPVDFLIVTALRDEFQSVTSKLSDGERVLDRESGLVFYRANLRVNGGDAPETTYDVVVVLLGAGSGISAATTMIETMRKWKPSSVLLVGITTGLQGRSRLGDVLVAERFVNYDVKLILGDSPVEGACRAACHHAAAYAAGDRHR